MVGSSSTRSVAGSRRHSDDVPPWKQATALVFPTADQAAQGAIELVDACAAGDLPSARAGLSLGQVLTRGGDYFGRAVNLASRLVDVAPPDTVLADDAFAEAIGGTMTLVIEPQKRKRLKGIGSVHVWRLRSAGR